MCVWSSRRVLGVKYMHVLDLQTRKLFFSSLDSIHHLTTMEQEKKQRESIDDYEEAQSFLKQEEDQDNLDLDRFPPPPTMIASSSSSSKGLSNRFWISACVNTASTAAIVRKISPQNKQKNSTFSHTTQTLPI